MAAIINLHDPEPLNDDRLESLLALACENEDWDNKTLGKELKYTPETIRQFWKEIYRRWNVNCDDKVERRGGCREKAVNLYRDVQRNFIERLSFRIRDANGEVTLSSNTVKQVREWFLSHPITDLNSYYISRMSEWARPSVQLDKRFVQMSLSIDQGHETENRFVSLGSSHRLFDSLHDVTQFVSRTYDYPPIYVLLGNPGAGKTTLLSRLDFDLTQKHLRDDDDRITFFAYLGDYNTIDGSPKPQEWLESIWQSHYPDLPALNKFIDSGKVTFILDALNEMPHQSADEYAEKVRLWRQFLQKTLRHPAGNIYFFSCRSLDYSEMLSSKSLPVLHIYVQPLTSDKIKQFLHTYLPDQHATAIWNKLTKVHYELYSNPFLLSLLIDTYRPDQSIANDQGSLFSSYIRSALIRELKQENNWLSQQDILTRFDRVQLINLVQQSELSADLYYELPERGALIPALSRLAYRMQEVSQRSDNSQVQVGIDDARKMLDAPGLEDAILKAGVDLNVLDHGFINDRIKFSHQLLQEYFAARLLAKIPDPKLVQSEWRSSHVSPPLLEALMKLTQFDPLPELPTTGWEETTVMASVMSKDPNQFVRAIQTVNLSLAARCCVALGKRIRGDLENEIRNALLARIEDKDADLRARIDAGLWLGKIGDPRFKRYSGELGEYMLPPLVTIRSGIYTIGGNNGETDILPIHTVRLEAFQIAKFPVTNAEYRLFIDSGGYEENRWWTPPFAPPIALDAKAGNLPSRGREERYEIRQKLRSDPSLIDQRVGDGRMTSEVAKEWKQDYIEKNDQEFEEWLNALYPLGRIIKPGYFDDPRFNNPSQPVVGVSWYEANAYCAWLSAQSGKKFRLLTEVELEAAARGLQNRQYSWGDAFDLTLANTAELHVRRTTPVGIFPGQETPEGCFDMTSNMWQWTNSIYKPYPYEHEDGREDFTKLEFGTWVVYKGGAWRYNSKLASTFFRGQDPPDLRIDVIGFRIGLSID